MRTPTGCAHLGAQIFILNALSVLITFMMSSVWHAILDNFRPISVWGADLALFYWITHQAYGEQWTDYSFIQLGGMFVLFLGTAIYNGSVKLPCFTYTDAAPDDTDRWDLSPVADARLPAKMFSPRIRAPEGLASPALFRSPLLSRAASQHLAARRTRSLTR